MSGFSRIKTMILGDDIDLVNAFSHKVPNSIRVEKTIEGKYTIIKVVEIDNKPVDDRELIITEVKDGQDEARMVNDLMMTYLDIPESVGYFFERMLKFEGDPKSSSILVRAS